MDNDITCSWRAGDNQIRHISVFCDDFEAFYGVDISNDIVENLGSMLLNPGQLTLRSR